VFQHKSWAQPFFPHFVWRAKSNDIFAAAKQLEELDYISIFAWTIWPTAWFPHGFFDDSRIEIEKSRIDCCT
jgi:hypothetical protein